MPSSLALQACNISKIYRLYQDQKDRFLDIVTRGRFHRYTEFHALHNVSFQVKKGQSMGILGRNGAGKSTLLQILSGIVEPTTGSVQVNGRVSALLELGAGFNPDFTGMENIALSATIYGVPLDGTKADEILRFADIGEFIDQPVKTYSSGMYIRLAFAIVSQMEPDILIVDEALSVGDLQFQSKCLRLIERLRRSGCTFIFVSHSPRMIELFCDRAIWLHDGTIRLQGEPRRLVRAYENFMVGGLDDSGDNERQTPATLTEPGPEASSGYVPVGDHRHVDAREGFSFFGVRLVIDGVENPPQIPSESHQIIIQARYRLGHVPAKPLWAVGIFNELNQPVIHFNTDNAGVENRSETTGLEGVVRFSMRIPAIRPGDYLVAIGLDDGVPGNSIVLMHIYDACKLAVVPSASPQAGYLQLHGCEVSNA